VVDGIEFVRRMNERLARLLIERELGAGRPQPRGPP
jgi:hypothetical protein